jgi:hypothetical protein
VQKNRNDAIELTIEDTDPQLASDMANAAREKIDEFAQRLTKDSQAKLLASFDSNLKRKTVELSRLGDSVRIVQTATKSTAGANKATSSPDNSPEQKKTLLATQPASRYWMATR